MIKSRIVTELVYVNTAQTQWVVTIELSKLTTCFNKIELFLNLPLLLRFTVDLEPYIRQT